MNRPILFL